MPQSQQGYDLAPLPDGTREQVKGRRVRASGEVPPVYGDLYALEAREFDALALLLFETDWSLREAWWVPWEAVEGIANRYERAVEAAAGTRLRVRPLGAPRVPDAVQSRVPDTFSPA